MNNFKNVIFVSFIFNLLSITFAKDITVIAHRGASGYLPEHTLEAASLAHGFNVDYIEPDLVMTKDNKIIVLHDIYLDTTTNIAKVFPNRSRKDKKFYAIDFTLNEIKMLRVHEREKSGKRVFNKRFPKRSSKFEIPTLSEFIELIQGLNKSRNKNIGIYPEIKKPEFHLREGKDITKAVIKILRKYKYETEGKIFVQCFWPETLKRLKDEFKTKIPLVQLIADNSWSESSADYLKMLTQKGLKEISSYAKGIGPWLSQVINKKGKSTGLVENAKRYGLVVHPYTHRSEQVPGIFKTESNFFHTIFNKIGVDGIFSDQSDNVVYWKSR